MSDYYKFLGTEVTLPTTANTISSAPFVRLANPSATARVVTQEDPVANVTVATFTVRPASELIVKKKPTDTLKVAAGTDVLAVPVGS